MRSSPLSHGCDIRDCPPAMSSVIESIKARIPNERGAKAALADAVGLPRDVLSKILNGQRNLSADEHARIEQYFDTIGRGARAKAPEGGFADTEARPWTVEAQPEHRRATAEATIRFLAGNAGAAGCLELREGAPAFGLLEGDVVIIDSARPVADGDIAAVQVVDDKTARARTLIARRVGDALVSGRVGDPHAVTRFNPESMSYAGPVIASFRPAF